MIFILIYQIVSKNSPKMIIAWGFYTQFQAIYVYKKQTESDISCAFNVTWHFTLRPLFHRAWSDERNANHQIIVKWLDIRQ